MSKIPEVPERARRASGFKIARNILGFAAVLLLIIGARRINAASPLPTFVTVCLIAAAVLAIMWMCLRPERDDSRCPACGGPLCNEERQSEAGAPPADFVVCRSCGLSAQTDEGIAED